MVPAPVSIVSPTFVSDLFSDRSETVSDLFSARSETNGPPPKVRYREACMVAQSSSTKHSVPDSPVNFGDPSPQKVPAVIKPWPVTVRVHSKGQYSMLVELLFVPDKTDSKALRYALLRYCGGCMHLLFAPAPCLLAGSSRSWMLKPSSFLSAIRKARTGLLGEDW